jgi:hypothetical protein
MMMYIVGTEKEPNHKDNKGDYEIIDFIKMTLKLLHEETSNFIFNISDKFIDEYFTCLFKHRVDA